MEYAAWLPGAAFSLAVERYFRVARALARQIPDDVPRHRAVTGQGAGMGCQIHQRNGRPIVVGTRAPGGAYLLSGSFNFTAPGRAILPASHWSLTW